MTFHHNLFAHNNSRNPRFDHPGIYHGNDLLLYRGTVQFANNVVYNWGMKAMYGGEEGWFNVENNWFKPGPATRHLDGEYLEFYTSKSTSLTPGHFYINGNVYDLSAVRKGGFEGKMPDYEKIREFESTYQEHAQEHLFNMMLSYYNPQTAEEAYESVLDCAGASKKRDSIDKRIIKEVKKGKATFRGSVNQFPGIIDAVSDVTR